MQGREFLLIIAIKMYILNSNTRKEYQKFYICCKEVNEKTKKMQTMNINENISIKFIIVKGL